MARLARIGGPGGWCQVTGLGLGPRRIFAGDLARTHWRGLLGEAVERGRLGLHACVLTGNHPHPMLEPQEPHLARALKGRNTSYTAWHKRLHRRAGPLVQRRSGVMMLDRRGWGWSRGVACWAAAQE